MIQITFFANKSQKTKTSWLLTFLWPNVILSNLPDDLYLVEIAEVACCSS